MFLPGSFCPGGGYLSRGSLSGGGGSLPSGIRKAGGTHPTGMLPSLKKINLFQVMKQPVLATGLSNGTSNSTSTLNTVSDISASSAVGITTPRPLTTLATLFTKPRMHSPADRNGVQGEIPGNREAGDLVYSGKLTPPAPPPPPQLDISERNKHSYFFHTKFINTCILHHILRRTDYYFWGLTRLSTAHKLLIFHG